MPAIESGTNAAGEVETVKFLPTGEVRTATVHGDGSVTLTKENVGGTGATETYELSAADAAAQVKADIRAAESQGSISPEQSAALQTTVTQVTAARTAEGISKRTQQIILIIIAVLILAGLTYILVGG